MAGASPPPPSLLTKPVLPKTNLIFILFSNLGLITAQQTSNHVNCFMTGDDTPLPILSQKMHIVGERPGETPSALRCLSYLISSLLKTSKKAFFLPPSDVYVRSFLCISCTLIKFCYTKIGNNDAKAETTALCPPHAKS